MKKRFFNLHATMMSRRYRLNGKSVKMDKKVLLAIGAGVVALIAGVVGYSMMPKPDSAPANLSASDPVMQNINWVKQKAKEIGRASCRERVCSTV